MRIIKTIQLDDEDEIETRKVVEFCNMAANFFEPGTKDERGGLNKVHWLWGGHPLTFEHLSGICRAIEAALGNVESRKPHEMFPAELKKDYLENLKHSLATVSVWRDMVAEE